MTVTFTTNRALGTLLTLTLLIIVAGGGWYAGALKIMNSDPTRNGPVRSSYNDGSRIRFLAGHYPTLRLPNGKAQVVHSLLNIPRAMKFGDFVWNESYVPKGVVWVRIDLAKQTLSVFRAGHEIGSAVIIYGTDGKPTPIGIFHVLERMSRHRSSLYDADMPFMVRLTADGVAIHASNVHQGSATHGCVGVPLAFGMLLFRQLRRGDLVAILTAVQHG